MDILKYERTCPVAPIQIELIGSDMHYYFYYNGDVDKSVKPLKEVPSTFSGLYGAIECDMYVYSDDSYEFAAFGIDWDDPDFDEKVKPHLIEMLKIINEDKK